jgi:hypothetical protein
MTAGDQPLGDEIDNMSISHKAMVNVRIAVRR